MQTFLIMLCVGCVDDFLHTVKVARQHSNSLGLITEAVTMEK